jgi:hypothetical protein
MQGDFKLSHYEIHNWLEFNPLICQAERCMKCYDEVIDFIASGPSASAVASFRLSDAMNTRAELLVQREKTGELTAEERSELGHFVELEHIMRLAKARARQRSPHEQSP